MAATRTLLTPEGVEYANEQFARSWKDYPNLLTSLLTFATGTVVDFHPHMIVSLEVDPPHDPPLEHALPILGYAAAARFVLALQLRTPNQMQGLALTDEWAWGEDRGSAAMMASFRSASKIIRSWGAEASGVRAIALKTFAESRSSAQGEVYVQWMRGTKREPSPVSVIRVELGRNLVQFLRRRRSSV